MIAYPRGKTPILCGFRGCFFGRGLRAEDAQEGMREDERASGVAGIGDGRRSVTRHPSPELGHLRSRLQRFSFDALPPKIGSSSAKPL